MSASGRCFPPWYSKGYAYLYYIADGLGKMLSSCPWDDVLAKASAQAHNIVIASPAHQSLNHLTDLLCYSTYHYSYKWLLGAFITLDTFEPAYWLMLSTSSSELCPHTSR